MPPPPHPSLQPSLSRTSSHRSTRSLRPSSGPPPPSLYLLTLNLAHLLHASTPLAASLLSTLPNTRPLFIVLSLQELLPIPKSFLSPPPIRQYLDPILDAVSEATRKKWGLSGEMKLKTWGNVGPTGVAVMGVEDGPSVKRVERAGIGLGPGGVGSKGAVGMRVWVDAPGDEEEDGEEGGGVEVTRELELTFVAAHLCPDEWREGERDGMVERILRGLVFTPSPSRRESEEVEDWGFDYSLEADALSSPSESRPPRQSSSLAHDSEADTAPLLSKSPTEQEESQLFPRNENSYTFLLGDLNYRTSPIRPSPSSPLPDIQTLFTSCQLLSRLSSPHTYSLFLGLAEPEITFPPTYKYKPALPSSSPSTSGLVKNRFPSWTDRILYYRLKGTGRVVAKRYGVVEGWQGSDHRGVFMVAELKGMMGEEGVDPSELEKYGVERGWRERRVRGRRWEVIAGGVYAVGADWKLWVALGVLVVVGGWGWRAGRGI